MFELTLDPGELLRNGNLLGTVADTGTAAGAAACVGSTLAEGGRHHVFLERLGIAV